MAYKSNPRGDLVVKGFIVFGCAVWVVLGPLLIFRHLVHSWHGMRSNDWPSAAEGVMTHSQVVDTPISDSSGGKNRLRRKVKRASLGYQFKVDGTTYNGHRLSYDVSRYAESPSNTVSRYRAGRKVDVYYDPSYPQRCVLVPGTSKGFHFWFSIVFFSFSAIFCGFLGWRMLKAIINKHVKEWFPSLFDSAGTSPFR